MRYLKFLPLYFVLVFPVSGHTRTLSFDSGYIKSENSNRAFSQFGLEWLDAQSFLFDTLHKTESPLGNGLFLLGASLAAYPLTVDYFMLSFHEFGHFGRAYAVGLDPRFEPRASNFFDFFGDRLSRPVEDASIFVPVDRRFVSPNDDRYVTPGPFAFTPSTDELFSTEWGIVFGAGGVNNEMRFASDLAERLKYGEGHVYEWVPYMFGTFSSVVYDLEFPTGQSDLRSVSRDYGKKGLSISVPDMTRANLLSFLGSAATWSYGKGIWDFVAAGESRIKALSVKGVYLPTVSNYLTTQGISFRVASGYRLNENVVFPFAVEFIGVGGTGQEYNVGWRHTDFLLKGLAPSVSLTMGRGLDVNASLSYDASRWTRITFGVERYDVDSFYGERNITSTETGGSSSQVWGRFSFLY